MQEFFTIPHKKVGHWGCSVKPAKLSSMKPMKKKDGIAIAGSAAKLARVLNVSRSAITQWGEWMPPYRVLQLRNAMPERFTQELPGLEKAG